MLFDTHAHLDDRAFNEDRAQLLESLKDQGLIMNPGCSLESSKNAVALANKYDFVYAAVGSHPDAADEVNEEVIEQYRTLCKEHSKVKAIGEIGIDYHYEDIPRDLQLKAFRMQMELAKELNLPAIVHEREAHEDGLAVIREFPEVTGVLTFKNARKALEVAAGIPHDRIVIETDCPYMAPEPFRGKRNHPGYIYRMAEKLAELWEMPVEQVQDITTENGKKLYRI